MLIKAVEKLVNYIMSVQILFQDGLKITILKNKNIFRLISVVDKSAHNGKVACSIQAVGTKYVAISQSG